MKITAELQACLSAVAIAAVCADSQITSQMYYFEGSHYVTDYVEEMTTLSALMCAEECMQRPTCHSFDYVSFMGECYIQSQTEQNTESDVSGVDVTTYVTVSACERFQVTDYYEDADTAITWGLSGLEGNILCNEDYIYSIDNPIICNATGQWSVEYGVCKQRVWRDLQVSSNCLLPRPISAGWTMCARGNVSSNCSKFSLNLIDSEKSDTILHVNVRFSHKRSVNVVLMSTFLDGVWYEGQKKDMPPTLQLGMPFEMQLRLLSDTEVQISFNGTQFAIFQALVPVTTADTFRFNANDCAYLHVVDTWSPC